MLDDPRIQIGFDRGTLSIIKPGFSSPSVEFPKRNCQVSDISAVHRDSDVVFKGDEPSLCVVAQVFSEQHASNENCNAADDARQ